MRAEIAGYLELGYDTVKIKIGGAALAEDVARIETVLELLPAGSALAVDANGRFDLGHAIEYGEAIEPYDLRWYEEPGDPLDYALNAELAGCYGPPLATSENIFSMPDARNLLRYAGLRPDRDVLQRVSASITDSYNALRMSWSTAAQSNRPSRFAMARTTSSPSGNSAGQSKKSASIATPRGPRSPPYASTTPPSRLRAGVLRGPHADQSRAFAGCFPEAL